MSIEKLLLNHRRTTYALESNGVRIESFRMK